MSEAGHVPTVEIPVRELDLDDQIVTGGDLAVVRSCEMHGDRVLVECWLPLEGTVVVRDVHAPRGRR